MGSLLSEEANPPLREEARYISFSFCKDDMILGSVLPPLPLCCFFMSSKPNLAASSGVMIDSMKYPEYEVRFEPSFLSCSTKPGGVGIDRIG